MIDEDVNGTENLNLPYECKTTNPQFQSTVHPKMKMLSLFTHPHVTNPYDFSSVKYWWVFAEFTSHSFHCLGLSNTKITKMHHKNSLIKNCFPKKKVIWAWNEMRVSKRWQHDLFWVNYPFKHEINGSLSHSHSLSLFDRVRGVIGVFLTFRAVHAMEPWETVTYSWHTLAITMTVTGTLLHRVCEKNETFQKKKKKGHFDGNDSCNQHIQLSSCLFLHCIVPLSLSLQFWVAVSGHYWYNPFKQRHTPFH